MIYLKCPCKVSVFPTDASDFIMPSSCSWAVFLNHFGKTPRWLILNYNTVHSKDILGGAALDIEIEYYLYQIRSDKGISSRKLSELSGVSKSTINNIENNRYEPTLRTICMIAQALQVAPEDLYSYNVTL